MGSSIVNHFHPQKLTRSSFGRNIFPISQRNLFFGFLPLQNNVERLGSEKSNFSEENLKLLQSRKKRFPRSSQSSGIRGLIVSTFEDSFQRQDRLLF